MKCKLLGYTHLFGTSKKNGKPYDFYSLAVSYDGEHGYVGKRVMEVTASPDDVKGIEKIVPPFDCFVMRDLNGKIQISFT